MYVEVREFSRMHVSDITNLASRVGPPPTLWHNTTPVQNSIPVPRLTTCKKADLQETTPALLTRKTSEIYGATAVGPDEVSKRC